MAPLDMTKTISVIIPAYNEEKRLPKTLRAWQKFLIKDYPDFKIIEIIIADDGSKDRTSNAAEYFNNSLPIKTIKISPNRGKGFAVRTGIESSSGDFVFIYDADAAVQPGEIVKLLPQTNEYDIVIGSRMVKGAEVKMSMARKFIGLCFHSLCFILIPEIKDASCGAKLIRADAAKKLFELQKIDRFAFDIEILWLAKKLGFKIKEVGVAWNEIPGSKVKIFHDSLEMFISVAGLYKKHFFN